MKYLNKSFSVYLSSKKYSDNYDKIFKKNRKEPDGKKDSNNPRFTLNPRNTKRISTN